MQQEEREGSNRNPVQTMPPAKSKFITEDSRSEGSTVRERQIAAAAHARKSKNGASAQNNGSSLKDLALASADASNAAAQGQGVSGVRGFDIVLTFG